MGSDGLEHEDISGVFLDDAWTDKPQTREPFWPKEDFAVAVLLVDRQKFILIALKI